jgi:hypothetical protein
MTKVEEVLERLKTAIAMPCDYDSVWTLLDNSLTAVRAEQQPRGHVRCFWCHDTDKSSVCFQHHRDFFPGHEHPFRHESCRPGLLHDAEVRLGGVEDCYMNYHHKQDELLKEVRAEVERLKGKTDNAD